MPIPASHITSQLSHNPYFNRWFSAIRLTDFLSVLYYAVTILILIDGFLQCLTKSEKTELKEVTILILIDGFLQYQKEHIKICMSCHNPYFNRWFSAILLI